MTFFSSNRVRLLVFWTIAIAVQGVFALVTLSFPSSFGYRGKILLFDDVRIYFDYARPILEGRLPYRDYPVEYPVLALPFFVAPLVVGGGFEVYKYAFAAQMFLIQAGAVWLIARDVERVEGIDRVAGRLGWLTLVFVALCPMILARFDLAPMLLAFASARWFARGRMGLGGVVAGLGVLVKLVPGLVVVPMIAKVGDGRPKLIGLASLAATVGLGSLGWWWLGGDQVARSFRYHGERGLEIGSLYSSAYLVAHQLAGVWVFTHFDHGSMNVSGPGSGDAASLSTILQGALLALVVSRSREAGSGQEMRFAAASLLAYILLGKVLSPQYLIWLIPFVGVLDGKNGWKARSIFLVCAVLTTALYPYLFHGLSYFEPRAVIVLAMRNLGLAWLFAILIGRPGEVTPTRSSPEVCS